MQKLISLVWNREERRARALLRLLFHYILILATSQLALLIIQALSPDMESWYSRLSSPQWVLTSFFLAMLTVGATYFCGRFLDKRKFADFGLMLNHRWWRDCLFGVVLAFLQIGMIFLVELLLGWVKVESYFTMTGTTGNSWFSIITTALLSLSMLIFSGIKEEIITRAYQLKNLIEGCGAAGKTGSILIAMFLSASYFGAQHLINPSASIMSTVNLTLAGIMYAYAFVLTGRLALPLGLHISWNFCEGVVFGYAVSGYNLSPQILSTSVSGPEIFTGGSFGPEAGLLRIPAMLICALLITAWVKFNTGEVKLERDLTKPDEL